MVESEGERHWQGEEMRPREGRGLQPVMVTQQVSMAEVCPGLCNIRVCAVPCLSYRGAGWAAADVGGLALEVQV